MRRSLPQRVLTVLLAILVTISFSVILTGTTHAASKKTCYLVTKTTVNGKTESTYTYTKKGLLKTYKDGTSPLVKYVRNKKGYLTKVVSTKGDGYSKIIKRNKNNLPLVQKYYDSGKLSNTTKFKYWKNKIPNYVCIEHSDGTLSAKFDKYQNLQSYLMKDKDGKVIYKTTQKNTLHTKGVLKGYPKKSVVKEYSNYDTDKEPATREYTETYTYKTKHGKITQITKITRDSDNKTEKEVLKVTYKKFKVPKKYQKLLAEPDCPSLNFL